MAWTVEINVTAEKQLRKLDRPIQKRLLDWLDERISGCKDPRHFGEPLRGDLTGLWRYRVGDFRIICEIQDQQLIVLALAIGHRREIYRG
ncbi:MAG: type II toxin-antitoxin system RelE/ParE family toxin [Thermodesulfobacteriota bacterium]|nr:type II toxin-antitoxin system RelE/ParE family toxin [Thermodesulfobacteriota bacterium]